MSNRLSLDHIAAAMSTIVEDSLAPETGEGAGRIGLELLRWPEPFDAILVALGNGALLTEVGRWVKAHAPQTRVVGVVAAGAPAMADSWQAGRSISSAQCQTIADGIAVRVPILEVLEDMRDTVDEVLRVEDASLIEGMRLLHAHAGLVAEPSGAMAVETTQGPGRERCRDSPQTPP